MPSPYIFAFYSFKGGVGRSMAAMNTAYALSGRGRHVLLVDMDLEAPGISGFLERTGELDGKASGSSLDILALLEVALAVAQTNGPDTLKQAAENLPGILNYSHSVTPEKLMRPKAGSSGRLDVLGIGADYHARLINLELAELDREKLAALSSVLHYYFKAQRFPFRPLGVEEFEPPVETPYDYVLVDSRTGRTEIGGLCVGPLADRLVVLTGLNDQNIRGTAEFLEVVGIKPERSQTKAEPWDEADIVEKESPSLGPKPTILVASPVPTGELAYRRERLSILEKQLGIQPIKLSYHPQMALMETVLVRDYPDEYLALEYFHLTDRVMERVSDDEESLSGTVIEFAEERKGDVGRAIRNALRLISVGNRTGFVLLSTDAELVGNHPLGRQLFASLAAVSPSAGAFHNWGIALAAQAVLKEGAESDPLFEAARAKYAEALRIKPLMPDFIYSWGAALAAQGEKKYGTEANRLYEAACGKYAEALRLKPDMYEALSGWGVVLGHQARLKGEPEADRVYEEAYGKFAKALRVKPDAFDAVSNWGTVLVDQAKRKPRAQADELFELAFAKYAEAFRLKPDGNKALFNWGVALATQAKLIGGPESDLLYEKASEKFSKAAFVKPPMHEALYNWGVILAVQAEKRLGAEATRLFEEACGKYDLALQIKPDLHAALYNWGFALAALAKWKSGAEAERLYEVAYAKYAEALRVKPDKHEALFNWGAGLVAQAKNKTGAEADRLYDAACEKFAEALLVKPDMHEALSNWGDVLAAQAKGKSEEEADDLFETAYDKYAQALRLKPDQHGVLCNWGIALADQAKSKVGPQADHLYESAFGKYAEALKVKPKTYEALCAWGATLINQANTKTGKDRERLLKLSREKSLDAERILGGSGAYNLACLEAVRGNGVEAVRWLRQARIPTITRARLAEERDFDAIRHMDEFLRLIESLPLEETVQ